MSTLRASCELRPIKSYKELYQSFKKVNNINSNKIYIRECDIKIKKLIFSIDELKKYLQLKEGKEYNIVFENCKMQIFRYINGNDNISLSFTSCSTSKITILKSKINNLTIKDIDKKWKFGHKNIEIQICEISSMIRIESIRTKQEKIMISKTQAKTLLIKEYHSKDLFLDIKSIRNISIKKITTQHLFFQSSLLSENSIFIEDARKIEHLRAENCNFNNTEISKINLSKFYFPKSEIKNIRLKNIESEDSYDVLNSAMLLMLILLIFSIFFRSFLWILLTPSIIFVLSTHKKIYSEKNNNHEEIADIYRDYKTVFLSQGNMPWYHEMLYSEQLYNLKSQKFYYNIFNIKFYNYLFNGFGRRWRRALAWTTSTILFHSSNINKGEDYILTKEAPLFIKKLYESTKHQDEIKIDLAHSLSKLDISKSQSFKWFSNTDFSSYITSSLLTIALLFFIGSFIIAFKRRLEQ